MRDSSDRERGSSGTSRKRRGLARFALAAACGGLLAGGVTFVAEQLGGSAASAAVTWQLQSTPNIRDLNGVTCTSQSTCMVTGGYPAAAETTNSGTTWTNESSAGTLSGYLIHSVWCTPGLSWCIAVGGTSSSPQGAVDVWNGSTWTDESSALSSAFSSSFDGLTSVSCASQGTCVATGDFDAGVAVAYTDDSGSTWVDETSNLPPSMDYTGGVSCVGLTCMVVGKGQSGAASAPAAAISTNGGQTWTAASNGLPATADALFHAVDCPSASFCMAVGPNDPFYGNAQTQYVAVWDGSTWQVVTSDLPALPDISGGLTSVSCVSSADCVAVGDRGGNRGHGYQKIFVTTDGGTSWTNEGSMLPSGIKDLSGVSCAGTACYVVGRSSSSSSYTTVAYSADPFPVPPPLQAPASVSSITPTSGPAGGGTTVTLTGTNLQNAAYVLFGGSVASHVVDVSADQVSALSPPGIAGTSVAVQVITPAGTSPSSGAPEFSYTAPSPAYFALSSPARICDTRAGNPSGLSGAALANCEGKTLSASSPLAVQVSGLAGVPADASAVVANLTVVDPSAQGSLVAYPAGEPVPTASTLRFAPGANTAGLTEVGLSSSGAIDVATDVSSAGLIVDVEGYVAPQSSAGSGSLYEALSSPARICDTRAGNPSGLSGQAAQCQGNTLSPNTPLAVQISGLAGVPAGATAAVVNLTAIGPGEAGYLSAYPAGSTAPTASNLNFTRGQVVANRAVVTLSATGAIDLVSDASTNVAVDVSGYFVPAGVTSPSSPGVFHPLADPVRVCDTRTTSAPNPCTGKAPGPGGVLTVTLGGVSGVPSSAGAVVVELSAVDPTSGGFLSVYPAGESRPVVSDVNFAPGADVTNLVIATLPASGAIDVYNYAGTTEVTLDVLGWYQ